MRTNHYNPLTPYEQWMVQGNLNTIRTGEASLESVLAQLRAGGYPRIAAAVESACNYRLKFIDAIPQQD